jgi:hypothetical protein
MRIKMLALASAMLLPVTLQLPVSSEVAATASAATPQAVYQECIAAIHRAKTADQLPAFAHTSPMNKLKMCDSKDEEKEMLETLQEMTPKSVKEEGKIEFGDKLYLFFEGNPEKAAAAKEYFPVTVEMVKDDGKWAVRRQQSWHVKNGAPESEYILHGLPRVKRFEELLLTLKRPIPNQIAKGNIGEMTFRANGAIFLPREGFFKLMFIDGRKQFSVYIREQVDSLAQLQGRTFTVTPLDGYQADLQPDHEVFMPICARLQFGKISHGFLPGSICMATKTPESASLIGVFGAKESEDALSTQK